MRHTSLALLAPAFRAPVDRFLLRCSRERALVMLEVYETARAPSRQTALWQRGRDPLSVADFGRTVTDSQAYESGHQFGLALDMVFRAPDGHWTWDDDLPWDLMHELAAAEGLEALRDRRGRLREMPHLQIAGFDWRKLPRGPMDDAGWLAWLEAGGAFPTVTGARVA